MGPALRVRVFIQQITLFNNSIKPYIKNEELGEKLEKIIRKKLRNQEKVLNFLILLNPTSGTGQSMRIYDQFRQLLIEANIKHKLIKTTHRGHAIEIGQNEKIDDFDAAISISGDGLFHEMINGLLTREDGKNINVGLIPGKSMV